VRAKKYFKKNFKKNLEVKKKGVPLHPLLKESGSLKGVKIITRQQGGMFWGTPKIQRKKFCS
jgi:hypothetical protein